MYRVTQKKPNPSFRWLHLNRWTKIFTVWQAHCPTSWAHAHQKLSKSTQWHMFYKESSQGINFVFGSNDPAACRPPNNWAHPNGNKSITMDSILFKLGKPLNKTKKHTYTTNQINRLIKSCLTGYQCSQSVRGSTLDLWQKSNQIWTSINQQRWSVINWHFVKCLSRNTAMCLIT